MTEQSNFFNAQAVQKTEQAKLILKSLGLPPGQQNDRSALTLLALLDLKPDTKWSNASSPLLGITPIMEFLSIHYRKNYKPNTRETIRRQTIHQFVEAGIVISNPDNISRPPNSPKTVYQMEKTTLNLLRRYDTDEWTNSLELYLLSVETLSQRYARERHMERLAVEIPSEDTIFLSPGGQNLLIKEIIEEFCSRFTPGGVLMYVGDAADKWLYFKPDIFNRLEITVNSHGKMPDLMVYHIQKNWLVLIEAVTSHGPINPKRRNELQILFENSTAGLVFVTAFLNRQDLAKYINEISWETEIWVAESPTHLIHFDGERFLGPYE